MKAIRPTDLAWKRIWKEFNCAYKKKEDDVYNSASWRWQKKIIRRAVENELKRK